MRLTAVITIVVLLCVAAFGIADAVAYSYKKVEEQTWQYTYWFNTGTKDDTDETVEIVEKYDSSKGKDVKPGQNFGKVIDIKSNASYDAYAYIRTVLIVRADNDSITCFEDLKGKKTANSIGSTYMILAEDYGATALGVDTLDETITMVLQGRVDATLNAIVSYTDYMAQHPDAGLKIAALTEEANEIAIPMRKGDETAALREAVNQALAELREEGVLTELSLKYFGEDLSQ